MNRLQNFICGAGVSLVAITAAAAPIIRFNTGVLLATRFALDAHATDPNAAGANAADANASDAGAVEANAVDASAGEATAGDPNQRSGFNANEVFQVGELDNVNLFNGNVVVRIPLGQKYQVGPQLQYQLGLVYNSKIWDYYVDPNYVRFDCEQSGLPCKLRYGIPDGKSNAGFGWVLSLGRLILPRTTSEPMHGWQYLGPDGSVHDFEYIIDPPPSPTGPPPYHEILQARTGDSSYLQFRRLSAERFTVEFPDGHVEEFDALGRLVEMRDRFSVSESEPGNWVRVAYTPTRWTITDGFGSNAPARTHYVNFEDKSDLYQEESFRSVVSSVELDVFDNTPSTASNDRALYGFSYDDRWVGRGGGGERDGLLPTLCIAAPFLSSVTLPDGSVFGATYDVMTPSTGPAPAQCVPSPSDEFGVLPAASGVIQSLRLPTGGSIAWTHGLYPLNLQSCRNGVGYASTFVGVRTRAYKNRDGQDLMKWTYEPTLDRFPPTVLTKQTCEGKYGWIPRPAEQFYNDVYQTSGGKTLRTRHYFSAFPQDALANRLPDYPFKWEEYGLPLTHNNSIGSGDGLRLLSREVSDCTSSPCETLSRHYVLYESDPFILYRNHRMIAERTVELKDTGCSGACYTDTKRSDWDGFGHYRRTVTTSNYPGAATRTTYTNYTPSPTSWLLNLYTTSWVSQAVPGFATQSSKSITTFDANTGAMKSQRTLKATGANPDELTESGADLLTVLCRNTTPAGKRGLVTSERYFGGDAGSIPAGDLCSAGRTDGNYFIDHDYTISGSAVTAHQARYAGTSHLIADELLDARTGLVRQSKDPAGLATTFEYDQMGRITWARPQTGHGAWTHYEYSTPSQTPSTRSEVAVRQRPNGSSTGVLTERVIEYDDLGRVHRDRTRLKDGVNWSTTDTRYDAAGRQWKVSVTGLFTGSDPTQWTTTSYDVLGRPSAIAAPDGTNTTFTYTGSRLKSRSFLVATATGDVATSVTEERDSFGRLVRVVEAESSPDAVEAKYTYNFADKLVEVGIGVPGSANQKRAFDYDGRGFLTSETQPEKGTTSYRYDSRGHSTQQSDAGGTLTFFYDPAERLRTVKSGSSLLKEFEYADANDGDYSRGKLTRAVRHNYHALLPGGDVTVTEVYRYAGVGGALSSKQTSVSTGETFTDAYAYNELGAPLSITYPVCTSGCGAFAQPARTITNQYTNGYLSAVGNYASPIEYHPNGMVKSIRHRNAGAAIGTFTDGPLFEQLLSAGNGMARPDTIRVSNSCTDLRVTDPPDSQTINSGQSVTLSATIPGATSWKWYEGEGTLVPSSNASSITVAPPATSKYWVRAAKGTCTIDSPAATVTVNGSPCGTPTTTVTVLPAAPDVISPGGSVILKANVTGAGKVTWSDLQYQYFTAADTHVQRLVENLQTTTVYTASVVDSNQCPGTSSGSALVTVTSTPVCPSPAATVQVSGSKSIYLGENADIRADLTGAGPWTITWSDGSTETVSSSPRIRRVTPAGTTTYSVTEMADRNGCAGTTSGSAKITILTCNPPQATMSGVPDTMAPLTEQTATVSATGASPLTYAWTVVGGTVVSGANTTSFRFRSGCGPTTVSVRVTAACGKSTLVSKVVAVTTPSPVLTGSTVAQGGNGTLTVSLQGTAPWTLTWSDGLSQTASGSPHQRTINGVQTTKSYTVTARDQNGCEAMSNAATVAVLMPAPVMLDAVATASDRVRITWDFPGTADRFDILRFDRMPGSPGVFRVVGSAPAAATSYFDTGLPQNTAFLYGVVAVRSEVSSAQSASALATTTMFTDSSITPGSSLIRAIHIRELRVAVNAVRALANVGPTAFTDADPRSIRGLHIVELRSALDTAVAALGLPPVTYTPLTDQKIRATPITDMRRGVQ